MLADDPPFSVDPEGGYTVRVCAPLFAIIIVAPISVVGSFTPVFGGVVSTEL